ncbi:MAG: Gfo/Idh/MocA family oxidoreductase [Clostridia bacterium]|nr:Gfo/Idh/MocA family oxidoreductase [Clostridia bacterium]
MKQLKIGIIGTGGMGNAHAAAYASMGDRVKLVSCCDLDISKAEACAEKHGFERVYTDMYEMMRNEALDCVSVCTWNSAHKDASICALRGGAHVLCEKPMAMNAAEAREMNEAAQAAGKVIQIGFVRRFGADADVILRFKAAGAFGDIYYATAQYLRRDGCPGGWFADKAFSGGGPLIDLGVHVIDLVRYLGGNPKPVKVYGVTYSNLGSNRASNAIGQWQLSSDKSGYENNVEDLACAFVRFENGLTLRVEASFNLNIGADTGGIMLFGTKAGAEITDRVTVFEDQAGMYVNLAPAGKSGFEFMPSIKNEVRAFLDACDGTAPCLATGEDGYWLMKIIDAVYRSAETGEVVQIAE